MSSGDAALVLPQNPFPAPIVTIYIRQISAAIDSLEIPEADRRKICEENIRRLARHRLRG